MNNRFAPLTVLFLIWLQVSAKAQATDATAMVYWAEWCGACQILDPVLERAVASYEKAEIDIVRIDYTHLDYDSLLVEAEKAEALGVSDKVPLTNVRTGYAVMVIDGELRGRISAGMTEEIMHSVFDTALHH